MKEYLTEFKERFELEKANERISIIDRIFKVEKYTGILDRQLKRNKYHYNDLFNLLYEMNYYKLKDMEEKYEDIAKKYLELTKKY